MSQARRRICLATTSHPVEYSRFYDREACSLARAGYDVTLVGSGPEAKRWDARGVHLVSVPERRMAAKPAMVREVVAVFRNGGFDALQCLDPWVLEAGLRLKQQDPNLRLVYEASEHFPAAFRQRVDIPGPIRWLRARSIERLEAAAARTADAILDTNATRARRFEEMGARPVIVANYPRAEDLPEPLPQRRPRLAYTGLISRPRGFGVLLQALEMVRSRFPEVRLVVAGGFDPRDTIEAWTRRFLADKGLSASVDLLGWLPYPEMFRSIADCLAGVILLQPGRLNDYTGQPNKLFEFMGSGLAVVASDFPEMAPVVSEADCGWTVGPDDPQSVAAALLAVLERPAEAVRRGRNGRAAVLARYHWAVAEAKLLEVYARLLS